jgi:formamidopyrimidine-DNA glycosylase
MPEIAEISIVRRLVENLIDGKKLLNIVIPPTSKYDKTNTFKGYNDITYPLKVKSVNSKGKTIYISFDNGTYLLIKLLLSGSITYNKIKNGMLELVFENFTVYINDPLQFLYVRYCKNRTELDEELIKLGDDWMNDKISFNYFMKQIDLHDKMNISDFLLDQSIFSGVGNYIMNEVLYTSGIHPLSIVGNIPTSKLELLFKSIIEIIHKVYVLGGVNIKNHTDLYNGSKLIDNKQFFQVYRKTEDPLGNKVSKMNRTEFSSYYIVKKLQKKY